MVVPLRAIGVFHAVARAASISKAAGELGVTPSAVSQQIHALESLLGATLLVKAGRRIKLTEAGERFFAMIADPVDHIVQATDHVRGDHGVTSLIVRATPTFSTKWLMPRLSTFIAAYPHFEVRLDGTNEPTDFAREHVDVEIRHGEGNWFGLYVEGIAKEQFLPVCAPSYAGAASIPVGELPAHRLIHSVKSQIQWPAWLKSVEVKTNRRWRRVLFDRSHMAIDAAVAGMGIALESNFMMWREVRDGSLICPVINPPAVTIVTQWIVCPHDHLRHFKVRAFIDWIRRQRDDWSQSSGLPAHAERAPATIV
jgi:LysR family transcriptional regulator, glycine cleavage system transcriptional activator